MATYIVLLAIRQYEGKSYRMFVEWLVEAYYLRMFLQLSHIPHCTTLQKFAARINGTILAKIISSFILLLNYIHRLFIGIDSSGFKLTNASQYYTDKAKLRKKYLKLSKCRFTFSNYMHCQNKSILTNKIAYS